MLTRDISKDVLCNIITDNLDILRQCIEGTIYQQWTAVVLLMQFIEYLLKYKIQSAGEHFRRTDEHFPRIHKIKKLYCELTDDDRDDIEERFSKLMKVRDSENRDKGSFNCIKEFARRYNTAYLYYWRYGILDPNFESDEEYFYLADTFTVLRALIESTDLEIDLPSIANEDKWAQNLLKAGVRWGYLP